MVGGGFVDEMRCVAMKLHSKDQSKEGEKETQGKPWPKWEPSIHGYLNFLVDSKLVYDTLDKIIHRADFRECKFFYFILFYYTRYLVCQSYDYVMFFRLVRSLNICNEENLISSCLAPGSGAFFSVGARPRPLIYDLCIT